MPRIVMINWFASLYPLQKDRIGIPGIPLGNEEVLVWIYTNIMAMLENGFVLDHGKQFTLLISWPGSAGIGHHFVVAVKNGHETCVVGEHVVFQCRETNA